MKSALAPILIALVFLASCQSEPPPLANDAPAQIYFQRAQAASDNNEFDKALKIYQDFLANQPKANIEELFTARYEVALLMKKKGLYAESQTDFEGILADYDDLDKSSGAPGWVKILSQKMLQDVKDKLSKPKWSWFGL
jgi:tetratricopeptide (TPR) repeat protein